jgi:hypothetical protein
MEFNPELAPFIASWERAGFSEEQIAKRIERHIRLADVWPPDNEAWHVERAEDYGDTVLDENLSELPDEPDAAPTASPEAQAAIPEGMTVMADPGNAPRQTREPPRHRLPLFGSQIRDINDPTVRRMLDRFRPLSLHEIAKQKPPAWLVSRYIPENSIVELFGEYAGCKSFLAIDWSLSIAAGKPWLGRKVQQGHVIYVYAEGTQGLRKRALAWCKEHGLDDFPEKFHAIPRAVNIRNPDDLDYLALAIKLELHCEKPSLFVLDTLNRCFGGGEENSNKDMSEFVAASDKLKEEFGATVLACITPARTAPRAAEVQVRSAERWTSSSSWSRRAATSR